MAGRLREIYSRSSELFNYRGTACRKLRKPSSRHRYILCADRSYLFSFSPVVASPVLASAEKGRILVFSSRPFLSLGSGASTALNRAFVRSRDSLLKHTFLVLLDVETAQQHDGFFTKQVSISRKRSIDTRTACFCQEELRKPRVPLHTPYESKALRRCRRSDRWNNRNIPLEFCTAAVMRRT